MGEHTAQTLEGPDLIIIVEIHPATETVNRLPPFPRKPHHNSSALFVIFVNAHLYYRILSRDTQLLVDLILDG